MVKYATITEKGQITLPVEIRRALKLEPGRKLNIVLEGEHIRISKPADITEVRRLLRKEMAQKGTAKKAAQNGDGWASHAIDCYLSVAAKQGSALPLYTFDRKLSNQLQAELLE